MTHPPITITASESLRAAANLLSERNISGVPVVDAEARLIGVLSQKDILRILQTAAGLTLPGGLFELLLRADEGHGATLLSACRALLDRTPVERAMTSPPVSIDVDRSIEEAVRILLRHRINRLPVLKHDRLVGIVTRHDLLSSVATAPNPARDSA
jgi:CBS domain-containing protein